MSNIEAIKEDYQVGDAIRIKCSLGIKEGIIVSFTKERIKIRPFELGKKPISISEENIQDFEEAEKPSDINSGNNEKTNYKEQEAQKDNSSLSLTQSTKKEEKKVSECIKFATSPNASNTPKQPSFVQGFVDLSKVDPRGGVRPAVHKNTKTALEIALEVQPAIQTPKGLERSIDSYAKNDEENNQKVQAVGFITVDKTTCGFIWDQNLETQVWFSSNDLDDDELSENGDLKGVWVSYNKIARKDGSPQAVGITYPRPISHLLALADYYQDDNSTCELAYDILNTILAQYPQNVDALYLLKEVEKKVLKSKQHSSVSILDVESLKSSSVGNNKEISGEDKKIKEVLLKADKEAKIARELINGKKHEEALRHLLEAFKLNKSNALIKDISSLYCTLCSRKYVASHPDKAKQASSYREKGKLFLSEYANRLPKDMSTYYSLESFYYVLHEYDKFIDIVDKIIKAKAPSQRVIFMNKKVVALMALSRKEDAIDLINQVLRIDPQNATSKRLLNQINSNSNDMSTLEGELELSDNPISPYLQDQIDSYTAFFGVPNYVRGDENRLYSPDMYAKIEEQINDKQVNSDSQKRSQLLLTKIKISIRLYDGYFDKRDCALYCNDMARITLLKDKNNVSWDTVRFYYNESFSLTSGWSSARRQLIQYLETYIPTKRNDIFGKLPENEITNRLREDIALIMSSKSSTKEQGWVEVLIEPSIYNEDISNKIVETIYSDSKLKEVYISVFESADGTLESKDSFSRVWSEYRDGVFAEQKSLGNSFLSRVQQSTLTRLNSSIDSLKEESNKMSWLFAKDRERLNEIFNQVVPKIKDFIKAESYNFKEDNYGDATRMLEHLMNSISEAPTKFSYEALMPLLKRYKELLDKDWDNIVKTSKPNVRIELQGKSALKDNNNVVSFQVSVSTDKDSAPISKVKLTIKNSPKIQYIENKENTTYMDMLRGGDKPIIFHLKARIEENAIEEKAVSLVLVCTYETSNNKEETFPKEVGLRFYSESEYKDFKNPYNAGEKVTDPKMFFGRADYINNLVGVMHSSQSKQVIIYGQKRSGKSSVLYWLEQKLKESGAFCANQFSMADLIRDLREVTFYYQILYEICEGLEEAEDEGQEIPKFEIPSFKGFEDENPTNPLLTFKKYMKAFKKACRQTPGWENKLIVVLIDEFTYIYSYIKQGRIDDSIMKQWKGIIQDQNSSFAAVLVGQDVVPYFAKESYASNAFQIIDKVKLNYLEEKDARKLIEDPIRDENGQSRYAEGAVDLILAYTAGSPYYIQMLCGELVNFMHDRKAIIATTADVTEVADKLISNLNDSDFDNLISGGDSNEFEEFSDDAILAVLYRIAKLTENIEFCNRHDIVNFYKDDNLLPDEEEIVVRIIKNLEMRDIIEAKNGRYRIKVKLFQKWILKKKPQETASLKELAK